jgi:hypothetical protein
MNVRTLGCSWLFLLMSFGGPSMRVEAQSTAFYYGARVPAELRAAYDQIVVEPANLADPHQPFDAAGAGAIPVAYLSVGEQAKAQSAALDPAWLLGHNQAWASAVMDVAHPGYQRFLLARFEQLWAAGYRRFFLDTLDSYQLGSSDPAERERLRRAVCDFVRSMAKRHPDVRVLLNRGFELLPDIAPLVHGVVAESLFDRWDAAHGAYQRVPEADRAWLLARLREVRERYGLQVTVIDYRPASERDEARATARKITALGFSPWVCEGNLMSVGIGPVEIMPRRVLLLGHETGEAAPSGPARWLINVLEYLGYVSEYRDISDGFPEQALAGRYQGVITTFAPGEIVADYAPWLLRQVHDGVRVAIVGGLGFAADGPLARELGIVPLEPAAPGELSAQRPLIVQRDALVGFEAEPPAHGIEGIPVKLTAAASEQHLVFRLAPGRDATAIATTAWGGLALSHVFAWRGLQGERAWVLDPFAFLSRALALPDMPVPDVTTESGRRVALFAIQADGLAEPARLRGRPRVWSVVRALLDKQPWPHAIDLGVGAEVAAKRDQDAAQNLLLASTSYSSSLRAGTTTAHGIARSLTTLQPLFELAEAAEIPLPMAPDVNYLAGSAEGYAFRRVIETFEYTDTPRRLRPLALHFHAFTASSPGGLEALAEIYAWLSQHALFGVRVEDYRARIRAFREQVIVRSLDGSYTVLGGEALRTLRVPARLGLPDLSHSLGIASVATLPQARYVTFASNGPRRLQLGSAALCGPYLAQANGRVESFAVLEQSAERLRFSLRVVAERAAAFRIAGLAPGARCSLQLHQHSVSVQVNGDGVVDVERPEADTGTVPVVCAPGLVHEPT